MTTYSTVSPPSTSYSSVSAPSTSYSGVTKPALLKQFQDGDDFEFMDGTPFQFNNSEGDYQTVSLPA